MLQQRGRYRPPRGDARTCGAEGVPGSLPAGPDERGVPRRGVRTGFLTVLPVCARHGSNGKPGGVRSIMTEYLPLLPILLFSVVVHELAHGWMALRLGDPTARDAGRLTLNPLPHIDPIGSILVPLLSLVTAGRVFIAWAKPVPVNPGNFAHLRRDEAFVSAMGPLSNILLAWVCTAAVIFLGVLTRSLSVPEGTTGYDLLLFLYQMFYGGAYLNIVLAVFNLLPVPPLDGSHLVSALLPARFADGYRRIGFFGVFALIFLLSVPAVGAAFDAVIDAAFAPFRGTMTY